MKAKSIEAENQLKFPKVKHFWNDNWILSKIHHSHAKYTLLSRLKLLYCLNQHFTIYATSQTTSTRFNPSDDYSSRKFNGANHSICEDSDNNIIKFVLCVSKSFRQTFLELAFNSIFGLGKEIEAEREREGKTFQHNKI